MVLDLICDDLHRPAAYRFVCPDSARVVQGERSQTCLFFRAAAHTRRAFSLMLCKDTKFFVRFQILPLDLSRFSAQIR